MKKPLNILFVIIFFIVASLVLILLGKFILDLFFDFSLSSCSNIQDNSPLTGIRIDCSCLSVKILGYQIVCNNDIAPILSNIIIIIGVFLIPLTGSFFLTRLFNKFVSKKINI